MTARARFTRNTIRVVFLLLIAAAVAFVVEKHRLQNSVQATGHIIAKRRVPYAGPTGDRYEIVIEYEAEGQRRSFATQRAVWDIWGTLDTIGAAVPVRHLNDEEAEIDRFNYLYPVTTTILGIAGIGLFCILLLLVIPQSRLEEVDSRQRQYRQLRNRPPKRIGDNRRRLLRRMHMFLAVVALLLVMAGIGIVRRSAWLYITSGGGLVLLAIALQRLLVCPHCGASLNKDLKELDPSLGGTNWLIVRDNLAKGVPVTCSECGHSLDE